MGQILYEESDVVIEAVVYAAEEALVSPTNGIGAGQKIP